MRNLVRAVTALAFAATVFAGSTSLAYAAGPLYPNESSGVKIVDSRCEGIVSASSDSSNGNFYARTSVNIGCANGTLEVVYIDNSGVAQQANVRNPRGFVFVELHPAGDKPEAIRKVLEVVGGINGHSGSTTCYLFLRAELRVLRLTPAQAATTEDS